MQPQPESPPANDNRADPDVLARRAAFAKKVAHSADYRRLSLRLAKRQAVGGSGPVAANDNQAWPLAEQLRRDGNEVLLRIAERYRIVYDAAKFEPRLTGTVPDDFWSPEQKHVVDGSTGEIKVKGQKRSKTAAGMPVSDGTGKALAVTEENWAEMVANGPTTFPKRPISSIIKKWNGDAPLIAHIDAKPMLRRLQAALGPLVDVFEGAVIDGLTLTDIGKTTGAGSTAGAAGKALVMLGLQVIQEELGRIDSTTRRVA